MSSFPQPQIRIPSATRTRNPQIDNAKFVLIALVVIGHGMGELRGDSPLLKAAYHFIYLFHIPAFVYLSGSLARTEFGVRQGMRWLCTLLIPLLVFQAIYHAWNAWLLHETFEYHITEPYWLLWYLASLACWHLLLPPMLALGRPLLTACGIAILAGYAGDIGYPFSLSRTLVFLPFFIAGHRHGLDLPGPRSGAVAALLSLAGLAWLIRDLDPVWLYGSSAYPDLWGGPLRAGLLAASAVGVWAVLRLVPRKASPLTAMGRQSLAVYLLHGLLINAATALGLWASLAHLPPAWRLGLAVTGGAALACLLTKAAPWFRPLMNFGWLLHPSSEGDASSIRNRSPVRHGRRERSSATRRGSVSTSRQTSGLTRGGD
ncbi:acyltransferase family protein [Rhodanobacter sp. Col0626]|uniref:acyltransferase family protein n=1 Tax=Rhodanobacter sp. Col0626 TaxID=3415679 RepID=UPI003CE77291